MAAGETHRAAQFRSVLPGVEAVAIVSTRSFPRHAHDQFGIGVLGAGGHRSWSGVGPVEAVAGDVITVNPGEMHDGHASGGAARAWRMLYLEPGVMAGLDGAGGAEIARPVLRDAGVAAGFARAFAGVTAGDALAAEEGVLLMLAPLMARHGSATRRRVGPAPPVQRALRRLIEAPERGATLAELAGLAGVSRFQLLRGFARAVGATPHAFLLQQRVRLARRLLAAGRRPAAAAAEAGFADQSHLTRAFVRQFGVTPGRYREAVR